MNTGWISVVMPVYNGAQYLRDALNSIQRQNFQNLEVLLMDDGSTDETQAIAQTYPFVRYERQEHRGCEPTLNAALKKTTSEYITFLDADDWWSDDKVSIQLSLLKQHPELQIVAGYVQPVTFSSVEQQTPLGSPSPLLNLGSTLMRSTVFDHVGSFDEQIRVYSDWDWFLRAAESGIAIHIHKDVVLNYRRHQNNMTNRKQELKKALMRFLRKRIETHHSQDSNGLTADFVEMLMSNEP